VRLWRKLGHGHPWPPPSKVLPGPPYGIATELPVNARHVDGRDKGPAMTRLRVIGKCSKIVILALSSRSQPSFFCRPLSLDLALEGLAARTESRHATHVAGTIAGSGEYAVPVVASEDGSQMRECQIPAFGKAGR
jgi:hypothetical protein